MRCILRGPWPWFASSGSKPRHRNPPFAAHRSAWKRKSSSRGPKGFFGAAQKRNPVSRKNPPARPHGPRLCSTDGDENVVLVARARYLASPRRAHGSAPTPRDARLRADRLTGWSTSCGCTANREKLDRSRPRAFAAAVIALTRKSASREEDSYKVAEHAARVPGARRRRLLTAPEKRADVKNYLSDAEIEEQFDPGYHFKPSIRSCRRVFGKA